MDKYFVDFFLGRHALVDFDAIHEKKWGTYQ